MILSSIIGGAACERPAYAAGDLPKPAVDIPLGKPGEVRTLVVGAGCFWCVESVFEKLDAVRDSVSGYSGGSKETANYEAVCTGKTGHAEVVKVTYDASKISFGELLRVFFTTHDPTTKNRQGPDAGTQYRSAIFYETDEQKKVAEAYVAQLNAAKAFDAPIVTTLEPLTAFYDAEAYHQNFTQKNPRHPYITRFAIPKVEKVEQKFGDQVKKDGK
jgi:peptide-methionine (S)-S-oxide reductase